MGGHALLQGIFPTPGLNLCFLYLLLWPNGTAIFPQRSELSGLYLKHSPCLLFTGLHWRYWCQSCSESYLLTKGVIPTDESCGGPPRRAVDAPSATTLLGKLEAKAHTGAGDQKLSPCWPSLRTLHSPRNPRLGIQSVPLTSSSFTVPGTRRWDLSRKKKENTVDGGAEISHTPQACTNLPGSFQAFWASWVLYESEKKTCFLLCPRGSILKHKSEDIHILWHTVVCFPVNSQTLTETAGQEVTDPGPTSCGETTETTVPRPGLSLLNSVVWNLKWTMEREEKSNCYATVLLFWTHKIDMKLIHKQENHTLDLPGPELSQMSEVSYWQWWHKRKEGLQNQSGPPFEEQC